MWTNRKHQKPKYRGCYTVFGTVNKGTEYETNQRFKAYWDNIDEIFTDKDGEDLTGINEGIIFWFDFSKVPDPKMNIIELEQIQGMWSPKKQF